MRGLSRRARSNRPRGGRGLSEAVQRQDVAVHPGDAVSSRSQPNLSAPPTHLSPTQQNNTARDSSEASASTLGPRQRRVRGPTRLERLWNRDPNLPKIVVEINEHGQPDGKGAKELVQYLGTMARKPGFVGLNYENWTHVDEKFKNNVWETVLSLFIIDPIYKDWVLESFNKKWRDYKGRLKGSCYIDFRGRPDAAKHNLPRGVSQMEWDWLVNYWETDVAQMRENKNKVNRSKQTMPHTSGTKSYARKRREEMVKNGVEPSRMQMFFLTHTKKDGTPVDQRAVDKIDEMQRLMDLQPEGYQDNVAKDDIFSQVMGEDRHGRVRMMGLGVKPSTLWGPRPTRQQLEREAIDARRDAAEARREAAEARRTVNEGFTTLVSAINQRLGGEPIDLATILRGISAQAPPNGGHLAPDSSSDPSA